MKYGRELPGYPYDLKAILTRCLIVAQRKLVGHRNAPLARFSGQSPLVLDYTGQAASDAIKALIEKDKPCLVARFGWLEMEATLRGLDIRDFKKSPVRQLCKFMLGESGPFWWDNSIRANLVWTAGYFPETNDALMRFSEQVCKDIGAVDLLASYVGGEKRLCHRFSPEIKAFDLGDYEPYWHDNPWTSALEGKTVLVINPFAKSIKNQYAQRERLFENPRALPRFNLKTYKSVSSLGCQKTPFKNWFEALSHMCDEVSKIDFDVALIGAGAYGMSLGAFIKRELGRKALHTGGMTQLIFGIKGKRWDEIPKYREKLYNNYWIRPLAEETIPNAKTVESGGYW